MQADRSAYGPDCSAYGPVTEHLCMGWSAWVRVRVPEQGGLIMHTARTRRRSGGFDSTSECSSLQVIGVRVLGRGGLEYLGEGG